MLRKLCLLLLSVAVCCPAIYPCSSSHHSSSQSSSLSKPVHVRGYTKKDGTYVAPHDRSLPGTAGTGGSGSSPAIRPYRSGHLAVGLVPHQSVRVGSNGKIKRSAAAKDAFKRSQPCPSNGKTSGSCPGYVIDHVKPLECGGADDPSNMQWQTVADGKAKDKTEHYCRN